MERLDQLVNELQITWFFVCIYLRTWKM